MRKGEKPDADYGEAGGEEDRVQDALVGLGDG